MPPKKRWLRRMAYFFGGLALSYVLFIHGLYHRKWVLIPMHRAAESGDLARLSLLLKMGALLDAPDDDNASPLWRAVMANQSRAALFLLAQGADPNRRTKSNTTPFLEAVATGKLEVARLMLRRGAEVNERDFARGSALFLAVIAEDRDMVKLLLDHGAKIRIEDLSGDDPLDYATKNKLTAIEKMLQAALVKEQKRKR